VCNQTRALRVAAQQRDARRVVSQVVATKTNVVQAIMGGHRRSFEAAINASQH
jgi:hypothetical protein